ncbi:antitoxin of toxin-antitoxin stability system [Salinarimonas chemoclinalis]|uniref:antitoxin of toxin-antitoxin stability system n=1 Tax=Salinarimonas chemoclinalis TaxID=3241599 RepID=UPI00355759BB
MDDVTTLTVELDPELRDAFLGAAAIDDVPPDEVLRALVRGYVEEKRGEREPPTPEYEAFLRRKVEIAMASYRAGDVISNEDVEAEFAERRRGLGVDRT